MAQKKQAQYTGAMDSVFDFIYSESKKTPAKVKPVKVTGLDSSDPYVAAAMAALENPLLFVNDTTVGAIKDVGNLKIHDFTGIDAKGGGGKAGFSLFNIGDVLNNNLGFVDKAFEKMEGGRKAGRMSAWGRTLAGMAAGSMAIEMGLDAETRNVLSLVGKERKKIKGKDVPEPVRDYELSKRGRDLARSLMGNRNFPDISEDEIGKWFKDTEVFGSTVSDPDGRAKEIYKNLQDIKQKYQAEMRKAEDKRDFSNVFNSAGSRDMHLFFESINFDIKASQARLDARVHDANSRKARKLIQKAQGYEDMKAVMFALDKSGKYQKDIFNDYVKEKKGKLVDLRKELSDKNNPPTKERAEKIRREIKSIDTQVRSFSLQKNAYDLGALETQLSSVKTSWEYSMGGGLLPAIINGDFFDENKNDATLLFNKNLSLQPKDDRKEKFHFKDKDGKLIEREFGGFAKKYTGENEALGKMMDPYYEGMMNIYYRFTPKGVIENLTTGSGTAFRLFKERDKLFKDFQNSDIGKEFTEAQIEEIFGTTIFLGSASMENLETKLGAEKFAKLMQYFEGNEEKFKKLNTLIKRADNFNIIYRFKRRIADSNFYKNTIGKVSAALYEKIKEGLLKMVKDSVVKEKIADIFKDKLGLKVVSDAIKVALKSYLTTTTAALGAFASRLIDVAVDLGMSVVEKMAKPVVKFLISGAVFGIVGLIGMIVLLGMLITAPFRTMKTLGSYSHVAPHEIVLGETDYIVPIEPEGPEGPGSPGEWAGGPSLPDGVSCLLGSNGETYRCSQGPYGNFSHSRLNAIDIAYGGVFYAPSFCGKGNCVIEYYGDFSCTAIGAGNAITLRAEYQGHVYRFIMYHVTLSSQLSMGSQVSSGQAVGQMLINGTVSGCWTGPHLHLEIDYDGVRVNPYDVLVSDPSSGGFGCSISTCP